MNSLVYTKQFVKTHPRPQKKNQAVQLRLVSEQERETPAGRSMRLSLWGRQPIMRPCTRGATSAAKPFVQLCVMAR